MFCHIPNGTSARTRSARTLNVNLHLDQVWIVWIHTWREVWKEYVEFQKKPTAHASIDLLEVYPFNEVRYAGESNASFPHRSVRFVAAVMPWYSGKSLDEEAVKCGKETRELWRKSSGREADTT